MDAPEANSVLFCPLKIGNGTISSRIIMAPMARLRNSRRHVPLVPMVPTYFAERASYPGTLVISEMTIISPRACGYPHPPGIWADEQVAAWKAVTAAVHAQGSRIYLQIGALGRVAHPSVLEEDAALFGLPKNSIRFAAPSPIPCSKGHPAPAELTKGEIKALVQDFAAAARRAVFDAEFDGVEVHGGYGYLIDQFIQDTANQRTDCYGGSVENRSRFALEVMCAVVDAVGPERSAIRLSPWCSWQGMKMHDPMPQFIYLIQQLRALKLSYLHLVEAFVAHNTNCAEALFGDSNDILIRMWGMTSPVILNHGFNAASAIEAIERYIGVADIAVSIGAPFMSNPDLIYRIKKGIPFEPPDRSKSHSVMDPDGYITYPFSYEWRVEQDAKLRATKLSIMRSTMGFFSTY
ncbi:aldolase-type tim barrel [Trichoderma arundinaceum]|uniref:Aldolase-type tim barrel n=1 Tax=Trichoderma arundinaceum TaxID=490622 RepID=A0A395NPV2_TRIAR|nr:aldolase-type tim barrel [Trichoderma arundinaceum]